MAIFYPPLKKIPHLKVAPTPGEQHMLDFLQRTLDNSYEVFYQSHLDGLQPDFVIVHKNHGILVIEVKDYHLDAYKYVDFSCWKVCPAHQPEQTIRSPFKQVKSYKDALCQLYFRKLNEKLSFYSKYYAVISAGVYFFKATHRDIEDFLKPAHDFSAKHILYWGSDDLSDFQRFFSYVDPYFTQKTSKTFSNDLYEEAVRVLQPDLKVRRHKAIPNSAFDKQRQKLLLSKAKKAGKVHGVAGSGKTEILVRRAVNAYRRTRSPVLITMFNITMRNYLQDRLNDIRGDVPRSAFDIIHYHALIAYHDREKARHMKKYKAIFVDEVQDFMKEWVDDLRNHWLYKDDNDWEIVFFGDEKQHLYETAELVQEGGAKRAYTGVKGQWNELKNSFRLDSKIALFSMVFLRQFATNPKDVSQIITSQTNLFDDSQIAYFQLDQLDCPFIYQTYRNLIQKPKLAHRPNDNDIVFLGSVISPVRLLEQYFRIEHKFRTTTTFESQEDFELIARSGTSPEHQKEKLDALRRGRKFNFWAESGTIKFSTIHSFKGWEMESVFIIIDNELDEMERITPELLYTAFTRAMRNLVIIEIGKSQYTSFFKKYFRY